MFKPIESRTISIINQKGGVGKSTITTLMANIFYFVFGWKVAIIDADYPQQTIYKRHIATAKYVSEKQKIREATEKLYLNRTPIQIYPTDMAGVNEVLDGIEGQYDLVFLDIAGTLNQDGIDKVLGQVHHFFIPVLQDMDTLKSSTEFYQILMEHIVAQSAAFKSCHFFLNNLPFMNQSKKYRNLLEQEGGTVLSNSVFHHVIYERAFRCTLLPIPMPEESKVNEKEIEKLYRFAFELLEIITANNTVHISDDLLTNAAAADRADSTTDSSHLISEREQIPSSSIELI